MDPQHGGYSIRSELWIKWYWITTLWFQKRVTTTYKENDTAVMWYLMLVHWLYNELEFVFTCLRWGWALEVHASPHLPPWWGQRRSRVGSTAEASWERKKSSPHDSGQSPAEDCADPSLVGPLWQPVKDVVNTNNKKSLLSFDCNDVTECL